MHKPLKLLTLFCLLFAMVMLAGLDAAASEQPNPLSFTLGVPGKTGCLVCHGDPKISQKKTDNEKKINLYISEKTISNSIHKDIACISCHTDFKLLSAAKDHPEKSTGKSVDYRIIAGLSCKNCHQHSKQLIAYSRSVHGKLALSGDPKKGATCADCHGSHDIKSLKKDKAYREQFHVSGTQVCGKCHKDYTASYNDYYHGKAYRQKAQDAPACWDCHGGHNIQRADDPTSKTGARQLAKACGKCHIDSRAEFAMQYGKMIHGSSNVMSHNLVFGTASKAWSWVKANMIDKIGDYYDSAKTSMFHRDRN